MSVKNALVLTGGGARAAYQVGVLRAISDITRLEKNPFQIISGFSAGAINGTWLASRNENLDLATKSMWDAWSSINTEQVFKTNAVPMSVIAFRWIKDRFLGSMQKKHPITYLLDTKPLHKFIKTHINFEMLNDRLQKGEVHGLAITAANYHTGHSTTFFTGNQEIKNWESLNRISLRTDITDIHVMASAAIPIFFPPIKVDEAYYGDGMVRLNSPLSAAIHMGAERLMVLGIRGPSATTISKHNPAEGVSISEIAGTILNGLFFDSLDADLARMERVNRTLSVMSPEELQRQPDHLRHIPLLSLRPSQEVADIPSCELEKMPPMLKFLLHGIGLTEDKGKDLLSYLSFEPKYLRTLLELGYEDTVKKKDAVKDFFGK